MTDGSGHFRGRPEVCRTPGHRGIGCIMCPVAWHKWSCCGRDFGDACTGAAGVSSGGAAVSGGSRTGGLRGSLSRCEPCVGPQCAPHPPPSPPCPCLPRAPLPPHCTRPHLCRHISCGSTWMRLWRAHPVACTDHVVPRRPPTCRAPMSAPRTAGATSAVPRSLRVAGWSPHQEHPSQRRWGRVGPGLRPMEEAQL
jgi:hypothetical protein